MIVIIKSNNKGIYKREIKTFERKDIKYYLYILIMKLKKKHIEIINE